MTDYMGMYNERFMKRAPQYGANAQARTYQDYMRGIQAQRMAAGQTFGNLAMQQQNQSFYDRATGRPPGLSGGMAQQFQNQMGAARSRQLGQVAQQRYQAFSDIAAQEAQAGQFARAQAMQEQEFQTKELALQEQKYAQANQIMKSNTLTDEQKQERLTNLGMTQGQIDRMGPQPGSGIVAGAGTLIGYRAIKGGARVYGNTKAMMSVVAENSGVVDATQQVTDQFNEVKRLRDALPKPDANTYQSSLENLQAAEQKLRDLDKNLLDKRTAVLDDLGKGKNMSAETKSAFKAAGGKTQKITGTVKGLTDEAKKKIAGIQPAVYKKKALSAGKIAFGKISSIAGGVLSTYLMLDIGSRILTGQGVIELTTDILKGDADLTKGGVLSLF